MATSQRLAPSISLTVSPSSNLASSASKRPKISKRQNARLQLAAALIEADNETLEAKAQAHLDAAAATIYDGLDEAMPAPAPPPEPKLASESVMFAPFRSNPDDYDAQSVARQPSRTRSIQRPQSRDFLGVNLPGQDRYQDGASVGAAASLHTAHSRNVSLSSRNLGDDGDRLSLQHPASRPGSALSLTTSRPASSLRGGGLDRPTSVFSQLSQTADGLVDDQPAAAAAAVPEDGLGDWGLDKFLTNEARQRITAARERDSERKRAISMVEVTPPVDDSPPRRPPTTRSRKGSAASSVAIARPWSPAAGAAGPSSRRPMSLFETGPQQRQRAKSDVMTTRAPASRSPDLDLLARIKLYRERQENLPPSQWGETPGEPAAAPVEPAVAKEEDAPAAKETEEATQLDGATVEKSDVPFPGGAPAQDAKPNDAGRPTTSEAPTPDTSGAIESMASDAASLRREGRVSWHQVSPTTPVDIVRRESVKGYTGESWSEQGSEVSHATGTPATSRSISMSKPSSLVAEHLESTAEEQDDGRMTDAPIEAEDNEDALTARRLSMAGIGSMAHSRGGSTDTAYASTVQQGRHRSFAPSPLGGGGWAGTASRTVSPAFMPASLPSSAHLDTVAALHGDYFSALALGPSPYSVIDNVARAGQASPPPIHRTGDGPRSSHMSPRIGGGSLPGTPGSPEQQQQHAQLLSPRMPTSGAALSTRQLQELARHSAFPESYGISSPFALTELEEQEQRIQEAQDAAAAGQYGWQELEPVESLPSDGWVPERQEGLLSKAFRPMTGLFMSSSASSAAVVEKLKQDMAKMDPDLSSSKWGRKKKAKTTAAPAVAEQLVEPVEPVDPMTTGYEPRIDDSLSRQTMDAVSDNRVPFDNLADVEEVGDDDDGVDDDYISPPAKGKLRPHGVEYWLPEVLVMPGLLEGSPEQPRTKLSEPEEDEYGRAAKQHRRRQSGLYVPEGFVLHDAKGAAVSHITDEGESRPRRTAFIYPVAAPQGIGRRALMSSTALFRNQLMQRDEDREGWGWESTSAPLVPSEGPTPADEGEQAKLSKREKRKAEKTASKEAKARLKRKRARALRRRTRRRAQREGKTCAEVGVAEESPVEDLSLTEDSEGDLSASDGGESEYDSDDEPRWVDDAKPAGKLFGKSLMDVAEERRAQRLANRRFYGQQEIDAGRDSNDLAVVPEGSTKDSLSASAYHSNEHAAAPSIMAPSIAGARSFRDNTGGGYNDTRERMQAAFGVDANWAREMAKRRDEEKEEEEKRRVEEEVRARIEEEKRARKEARKAKKGIFARQRKAKGQPSAQGEVAGQDAQVQLNGSMMAPAESYGDFIEATTEEQPLQVAPPSPPRPKTPLEPPRLDVPVGSSANGHQSTASGFGVAQWLLPDSDSDESSASDDERLASHEQQQQQHARRQIAPRIELGRLADDSSDSEDDEVPLAQLKRKSVMTLAPMLLSPRPSNVGRGRDSSDEDEHMTLAQLKRKSQGAASALMSGGGATSSPRKPSAASVRPSTTTSSSSLGCNNGAVAAGAASSSSDDDEVPLAQLRTNKSSAPRGSSVKDAPLPPSGSASDEDRPLGLRQGASQAVAAALATLQAKQHQPDGGEEEDEDDVPLGSTHPQAAIIARQAAQIRQLQQQEEARQRMSSMMGMGMPIGMGMGTPMMPQWAPPQMMGGGGDMMGMGMPVMPPSSTMMMSMPQFAAAPTAPSMMFSPGMMQQQPMQPQPQYPQEDRAALMSSPILGVQTPAQAVKASSIERWRDDVR